MCSTKVEVEVKQHFNSLSDLEKLHWERKSPDEQGGKYERGMKAESRTRCPHSHKHKQCSLIGFIFISARYFWFTTWLQLERRAFVLVVSPVTRRPCFYIYSPGGSRQGGCWSGLMYPNCRAASGGQTVRVCRPQLMAAQISSGLASKAECFKLMEGHLFILGCFACVWWMSLCVCEPVNCQTPLCDWEKGERLWWGEGDGCRVQEREAGGKDGERLAGRGGRGLRHIVGSIFFSYSLLWIERRARGGPCEWVFSCVRRRGTRRERSSSSNLLPSAKIWRVGGAYWGSSAAAAAHKERDTSSSCTWIFLRRCSGR